MADTKTDRIIGTIQAHTGYYSGAGWGARCLRWHLANLRLGVSSEEPAAMEETFTLPQVVSCIEGWLDFGESTYLDPEEKARPAMDRFGLHEDRLNELDEEVERLARGLFENLRHKLDDLEERLDALEAPKEKP